MCLAATLTVVFFQPMPLARAVSIEHAEPDSIGPLALATTEAEFSTFSRLPYTSRSQAPSLTSTVVPPLTQLPDGMTLMAMPEAVTDAPAASLQRPGSFVKEAILEPMLGLVSHRLWVSASFDSPDSVLSDQIHLPGQFRGVGFPDIRSHRKIERYNSYDPDQPFNWNSMVAWRMPDDEEQAREPIADVHCMGLSPQAVARRADRYEQLIQETAAEYGISASLVKAIVAKESCFDSEALSRVGAQGLMQLMPDTAQWLKVTDPLDPEENLRAGVRYIASLREQFGTLDLALAAYNAGPGNVRRYKGVPPFAETESYVQMVKAYYRRYAAANMLAAR